MVSFDPWHWTQGSDSTLICCWSFSAVVIGLSVLGGERDESLSGSLSPQGENQSGSCTIMGTSWMRRNRVRRSRNNRSAASPERRGRIFSMMRTLACQAGTLGSLTTGRCERSSIGLSVLGGERENPSEGRVPLGENHSSQRMVTVPNRINRIVCCCWRASICSAWVEVNSTAASMMSALELRSVMFMVLGAVAVPMSAVI